MRGANRHPCQLMVRPRAISCPDTMTDQDQKNIFRFDEVPHHEVFENNEGNIVITESDTGLGEQCVCLPPWRARKVAEALIHLVDLSENKEGGKHGR